MTRTEAVRRINDGLGFLPDGHSLESKIILRLQEAQRDLESGKTLPKFLLQEDQTLTLTVATHTTALPTGFIRENDDTRIRFLPVGSDLPDFLERKLYIDAVAANIREEDEPVSPSVYVIRKSVVDFITTADATYTLYWDYYKRADVLTSDIENAWLASLDGGAEWLIGKAGKKIAADSRDKDAIALFADMEREGRAACLGEIIASEEASGPYVMGANL